MLREPDTEVRMPLTFTPLTAALGAEVSGLDLREPLDPVTTKELHEGWLRHQVLFFREQELTRDQHKAFARNFGELHVHPVLQQLKDEGHPEIIVLESDAQRPFLADRWHSDVTFEHAPPKGSILRAVAVPETGGDTMWASMYLAYEALSDKLQRFLGELEAYHDPAHHGVTAKERGVAIENAVHPVVRCHPETGRKALFVNSGFTRHIVGMKRDESDALLRLLFERIADPDIACRFRWRKNSLAMWDNRCTQHRVVADARAEYRRMERVTLIGDAPRA
jgi:taurine dioxygenase